MFAKSVLFILFFLFFTADTFSLCEKCHCKEKVVTCRNSYVASLLSYSELLGVSYPGKTEIDLRGNSDTSTISTTALLKVFPDLELLKLGEVSRCFLLDSVIVLQTCDGEYKK